MLRSPFPGHRRYSITHRAVQRLRELVPGRDEEDDETLRDRLDEALGKAEDGGHAIRTLDAMLGEPQTLIPVDAFGDVLYAIIKEDTVVTVLPRGHGEEILQRGHAMEQRVAAQGTAVQGTAAPGRPAQEDERWDHRRRWRKDAAGPVVVERIGRPAAPAAPAPAAPYIATVERESLPEQVKVDGAVAEAIKQALTEARRKAAVLAVRQLLGDLGPAAELLPLWNAIAEQGAPAAMTVGDLIEAVRGLDDGTT
ncbi:MAG: hypothetical protein JKY37_30215 [Nannocystaceae bacterium]|nr:hypothetical protein [Nannocystaceae bacterium]